MALGNQHNPGRSCQRRSRSIRFHPGEVAALAGCPGFSSRASIFSHSANELHPCRIDFAPLAVRRTRGVNGFPRVLGDVARVLDDFPRALGDVARVLDGFPRARGDLARVLDGFPRALGDLARVLDDFPRALDDVAWVLGELPQVVDEVTRGAGGLPRYHVELCEFAVELCGFAWIEGWMVERATRSG